jgi:hypothetical protein
MRTDMDDKRSADWKAIVSPAYGRKDLRSTRRGICNSNDFDVDATGADCSCELRDIGRNCIEIRKKRTFIFPDAQRKGECPQCTHLLRLRVTSMPPATVTPTAPISRIPPSAVISTENFNSSISQSDVDSIGGMTSIIPGKRAIAIAKVSPERILKLFAPSIQPFSIEGERTAKSKSDPELSFAILPMLPVQLNGRQEGMRIDDEDVVDAAPFS